MVATTKQIDSLAVKLIHDLDEIELIYGCITAIGIAIGFLMLNTGQISEKNTKTMIRVSLIELMLCAFLIYALGYSFCMHSIGGVIGTGLNFEIFNAVPDEECIQYIVLFICA